MLRDVRLQNILPRQLWTLILLPRSVWPLSRSGFPRRTRQPPVYSWMVGRLGVKRLLFVGRYEQSLSSEVRVSMYKHARPLFLWDGARGGEKRGVGAHTSWPVASWHRIPSHPWVLNLNLAILFITQVTHHQRMQRTWLNSVLAWFITSKYLDTG